MLFLSEEYVHRTAKEVEVRAQLVFQEAAIRLADVLWKVTEERKCGGACRQLSDVLDLDVLAFPCWWRVILDLREHHLVQL